MSMPELMQQIAEKNRVVLSADDPIMMLYTMNDYLIQQFNKSQEEAFSQFLSALEVLSLGLERESKGRAERILSAALDASKHTLEDVITRISTTMASAVAKEREKHQAAIETETGKLTRLAIINVAAAVLSFCGGGFIFFAVIFSR